MAVQPSREVCASNAGLSGDQHGAAHLRQAGCVGAQLAGGLAPADDLDLGLVVLAQGTDAQQQLVRGDGLGEEVEGSEPDGLDGGLYGAEGREDHDVDGRREAARGPHHTESVHRLHA